jgi:tetratricopeptide (TPR) repeat protein
VYPRAEESATLGLDDNRRYEVAASIDRDTITAREFSSPFGDERWREIITALRKCASERSAAPSGDETEQNAARRRNRRDAEDVEEAGRALYKAIAGLAPALHAFLEESTPRRLVIESKRPEIHALPWEALTNDRREHVSRTDLSVVRCQNAFNPIPQPSPSLMHVIAISGPAVPERTMYAVRSIGVSDEADRHIGVELVDKDEPPAQLVHLVAHGDPYDATVAMTEGAHLLPAQLAEKFHDRLMVLLWSCYSAKGLQTDDSPVMRLQRAKNQFVLGFVAPLHFDAGVAIATDFYDQVFGQGQQDPESAITGIRRQLRERSFEFCDWASMTLWLDRPVDLSRLPLGRVRLPEADWSDRSIDAIDRAIRDEFERAALGRARLISKASIAKPLPRDLVRHWAGPVVHLDGPQALRSDDIFKALGLDPRRDTHPHDADLFLLLLDHLATYRFALILWTGVGEGHALLVNTLDRIPTNVGLVLVSRGDLDDLWPGRADGESSMRSATAPVLIGREGFLYLVKKERFDAALKIPGTEQCNDPEYWNARYVAGIKTSNRVIAVEAVERLKSVDTFESNLLQGNLYMRDGNQIAALDSYQRAADIALAAERWRDFARVRLEISYLLEEMGDRGFAEQMYRAAVEQLNETPPDQRNSLWTSALARASRDYAHLLAKAGNPDALPLVRRATAIHALEGRRTQAAYCFVTRGELACNLGKYDQAEDCARQAATVFDAAGNRDGWLNAVRLLAETAHRRGRFDQALEILHRAAAWPLKPGAIGLLLLDIADICWAAGRIDEAAAHARGAAALLVKRRKPHAAALRLIALTRALGPPSAAPRVATLAGRLLDNQSGDGSPESLGDLRLRLCRCFVEEKVEALVCSAARGADLLALDVAGAMGIRRRIVLPFDVEKFKKTSVDKPATPWSELYQQITGDAIRRNDLVVINAAPATAYADTNTRILDEAGGLANGGRPLAIVVWDGQPRGDQDNTAGFKQSAESRGFVVREIQI